MFVNRVPSMADEVLLPERRIESLRNTVAGIEVRWVCYCGHRGSFMTGRRRDHAAIHDLSYSSRPTGLAVDDLVEVLRRGRSRRDRRRASTRSCPRRCG